MTHSTSARAGRFHLGRLSEGRPQALEAWRVTTSDDHVASRIADLLGGRPQLNAVGGDHCHEVLTSHENVRVLMDGPDAVAARMVLWGGKGIIHDCDGSEFLSPEAKKGQPCGCPPLLEDRKLAAKAGRGPRPSVDLTFRIAAAPMLGEFHFMTSSWKLAAELSELVDALERIDGPAVCDLTMKLVVFTTKAGRDVCYRKPVVTVLGGPDTVGTEPPPVEEPTPALAPCAPRRRARRAPDLTTPSEPEPICSVSVDVALLRHAAQVLGTSNHQQTVSAALSEVVAQRQQATELAKLRESVGRIAALAEQALQGEDSSLT